MKTVNDVGKYNITNDCEARKGNLCLGIPDPLCFLRTRVHVINKFCCILLLLYILFWQVIKEKRRKLLESLIRIVDFYFKEDPSRGREFKVMIEEYKLNRKKKEMYHESVKNAQTVEINSIPLPDTPFETPQLNDIPLPSMIPQSILKKATLPSVLTSSSASFPGKQVAPGPPPGIPPAKKV